MLGIYLPGQWASFESCADHCGFTADRLIGCEGFDEAMAFRLLERAQPTVGLSSLIAH